MYNRYDLLDESLVVAGVYQSDEYDDLYIVAFGGCNEDGEVEPVTAIEVNVADGENNISVYDPDDWNEWSRFSPIPAEVDINLKLIPSKSNFVVNVEKARAL